MIASCYKESGQYDLVKPTLEKIPEIYFTKLGLMASLLKDEDRYEAAQKQKNISAEDLIDMLIIAGKYLKERGESIDTAHKKEQRKTKFSVPFLQNCFYFKVR